MRSCAARSRSKPRSTVGRRGKPVTLSTLSTLIAVAAVPDSVRYAPLSLSVANVVALVTRRRSDLVRVVARSPLGQVAQWGPQRRACPALAAVRRPGGGCRHSCLGRE
jgi:hypothetical protein